MGRQNRIMILLWGYVGEMVLAAIVAVAAWRFAPPAYLKAIVADASGTWTTVLSAFAGLAVAALIGFYAMTQNDFGVWLRDRQSFGIYALAFSVPLVVYMVTILALLMLIPHTGHSLVLVGGVALLAYSAIMLMTLLINLYEFAVLALKFKEVKDSNKKNAAYG